MFKKTLTTIAVLLFALSAGAQVNQQTTGNLDKPEFTSAVPTRVKVANASQAAERGQFTGTALQFIAGGNSTKQVPRPTEVFTGTAPRRTQPKR